MTANNYIKIANGKVDARLDVLFYKKDGLVFAYSPALDLRGYGNNEDEAMKSFEVVIEDYFEFGLKRNTIEQDLLSRGWIKEKKVLFELPNIWEIIAQDTEIKAIANDNDFNKRSIPFTQTIACC